MIVRSFKSKGLESFRAYLNELRRRPLLTPPFEMLTDSRYTIEAAEPAEVQSQVFPSALEAGRYLGRALQALDPVGLEQDVGLWGWLSLFYFDQVCPFNRNGRRVPGEDCRHILDLNFRFYHRHLLAGPFIIHRLHGPNAALLLCNPLHQTNKFNREFCSRQAFISNRGVVEAAGLLYFDPIRGRVKRGAAGTGRKPGALFRFIDLVRQLDLTFDLYSMSGPRILDLLPEEFEPWKSGNPIRDRGTDGTG
ncbi:MAG: hypothetical protein KKB20_21010 [Proteobacteria bacterium]|nr:hypothetical protein [Pseudomonadota bacterium]